MTMCVRGMVTLMLASMVLTGCMTSTALYPYRITNGNCNCEQFKTTDSSAHVTYSVTAWYRVNEGIATRVEIDIRNGSTDTLDLSLAYVRISSRNVPYRYNDKFLAVTIPSVGPGRAERLTLEGEAENLPTEDPWRAIAGEEVTITLKGLRMGGRSLKPQSSGWFPTIPNLPNDRRYAHLSCPAY